MENVPDLALADDMLLLRTIVDELESSGYGVHTRIVSAQDHGVPQLRQRLILVALELGTCSSGRSPKNDLSPWLTPSKTFLQSNQVAPRRRSRGLDPLRGQGSWHLRR